jgi:molybdate transport system permease protein
VRRPPAPLPFLAGLLALYLVAPFLAGFSRLGAADWAGADGGALLRASLVSVLSSTCATVLVAVGGVPLGYLLARAPSRAMALLGFVVQLPLALPPLASGILLLFLVGYASPLGRLSHGALTESFAGIVLAEAFVAAPFLIIAARSAFAGLDPVLEDVAASLGHRPGAVFRRVSLALTWREILAGMLLAWLRAFGEFGATVMVAYHPYSLPVYTYVQFGGAGLPAMLPLLLPTLAIAVAVMALSRATLRPAPRATPIAAARPLEAPAGPARAGAGLVGAAPGAFAAAGPCFALAARRRLDGFSLDVSWHTGARRLAILGPSGSGKSLTLRLIAGLGETNGSTVRFDGRDLGGLPPSARGIAYVPQNYALLPNLALSDQVRFAADADAARAAYWTQRLGLAGLEARLPAQLSLGQQQRAALARALARRSARLLLLDEPFSALDAPLRVRLRREMLAVQREAGVTTILVTHDPAEAMLLADELLLLRDGRVLQSGPVETVFARPAGEAAALLLGGEALGQGRVVRTDAIDIGDGVSLRVADPPLTPGARIGWCARPHQIRLDPAGAYPATLLGRGPVRDGQRQLELRLGEAVLSIAGDPGCPPPGPCRVDIDPAALQVWPLREGNVST